MTSLKDVQSAKVDARIKELVDNAPPFSPEQEARLRQILQSAMATAGEEQPFLLLTGE
jgi:hypothetical protein